MPRLSPFQPLFLRRAAGLLGLALAAGLTGAAVAAPASADPALKVPAVPASRTSSAVVEAKARAAAERILRRI